MWGAKGIIKGGSIEEWHPPTTGTELNSIRLQQLKIPRKKKKNTQREKKKEKKNTLRYKRGDYFL